MARLATIDPFGFKNLHTSALLQRYGTLGCRTCQFYRNEVDPPAPADARRIAEDAGVPIDSVHGRFGPELDPSSPDEAVRQVAVAVYRAEGELALELGGSMVVVHPSPRQEQSRPASESDRAETLRRTMIEMADLGHIQGVTYLFENLTPDHPCGEDPQLIARFVREIDDPHVRMCFDTGHAHITCPDVVAALEDCRDVVAYMHISDNDGRADAHAVPGAGTIEWDRIAETIGSMPAETVTMLELFESETTVDGWIAEDYAVQLCRWLAV